MKTSTLYTLSFSVYIAVSIFSFCLYGSMPALLAKAQMPPQTFSYVYLALLPFILSFFYSGFVESYRKKSPLSFKMLAVCAQCGISVCFFILALLDMADNVHCIFALFTLMSLFASVAIISLNGVGIEKTSAAQKPRLNTIMLIASGLGGIIGVIVCLMLCEWFSFSVAMLVLGSAILLFTLPLLMLHYPLSVGTHKQSIIKTLKNAANWRDISALILIVFPLTLSSSTSSALFVYLGFDLQLVGILSGVLNCLALLIASPLVYLLIQKLGFINALRTVLIFEMLMFIVLALNMQLWQSHLLIVGGLFLEGLCFGGQFIFLYTLGMRWCEDSQQSGVDFSFLRLSENAAFILSGVLASQILGLFIQDIESLNAQPSIPLSEFLPHILTHFGVAPEVGLGYMSIFSLSAIFVLFGLWLTQNLHFKE
ncbi:hypothetical protein [Helicobacter sp. MIT 14-3879]|uniref:hypothetical protein n=1 Tax=Helicobacter sp. MIT 14-3879 TaxID=2040649 RepID=UPI000E1EF74F|nr:hypothetical protein [Helicobacter sp. MIT 14-3879]RDU61290.1 hypothetical protein CQA44_09430 [Helicobacter sp. MIT 14-3879]